MLTTMDLLTLIEEEKTIDIRQLAKRLDISILTLKQILTDLAEHELVEYNEKTGKLRLPSWLIEIDKEIEELAPATGAIILPRFQEIKIQDVAVGNFTRNDLELKVRLKAMSKEIAICDVC
jgi:DNA-binding IclR family transcriptional regulator